MTTLNFPRKITTLFTAAVMSAFFVTSCTDNEPAVSPKAPEAPQSTDNSIPEGRFKKTITATDAAGKNSVTLQLTSDNESLLTEFDDNTYFIEVLTERPEVTKREIADLDMASKPAEIDRKNLVMVTEVRKQLENDAAGYKLGTNTVIKSSIWHSTYKNNIQIESAKKGVCVNAYFYYTLNNGSSWKYATGRKLCNYAYHTLKDGYGVCTHLAAYVVANSSKDYFVFRYW